MGGVGSRGLCGWGVCLVPGGILRWADSSCTSWASGGWGWWQAGGWCLRVASDVVCMQGRSMSVVAAVQEANQQLCMVCAAAACVLVCAVA